MFRQFGRGPFRAQAGNDFWQDRTHQRENQQDARQHPGHFARHERVDEAVVQNRDGRHAEQRAVDCPDAAKDARAAQHDGGDGKKLVARARVGLRLAEPRRVMIAAIAETIPAST